MNAICLVAGGPRHLLPDTLEQGDDRNYVGVDEGVIYLLNRGITPSAAFGDFDSISKQDLNMLSSKNIDIHSFESEKDMTDLELAIHWALDQNPSEILLFGGTGGRLDHELINIQLLKLGLDRNVEMKIVDRNNQIFLKKPGAYTVAENQQYPYLSFLPTTQVVNGITLTGFKYPLTNTTLHWGSTLCISNELVTKKGTYSFDDGIIMVVRSKD
ncbi:thiamine diphosphokinase [Pseudalkalibacillus berkeleyi]|uniref:Thiamine diphosphokinase n=1 Tax=Pseudalkalibacillus berkeleyi TaxID=1069813 RepID=A0ABS9GZV1_9BACL|nr:thiamine diphosphokinase [Pseudalkalibacillus berkeleyi]MCF6137062.1 thiamine diphosphokinase [Pseudalkalibacillus berkeleyi]